MIRILNPDGTEQKRKGVLSLKDAQALVGGYVELVRAPDGSQVLVDGEGKLKPNKANAKACDLTRRLIVGTAIVLTEESLWT